MKARIFSAALLALALVGCSESSTSTPIVEGRDSREPVAQSPRAAVTASSFSHDETLRRLYAALDRRDLTVFAVVDHAAGAAEVDLDLPPSTVVIFGSPALGTPLMVAEPRMALELPLKAAVYEDADGTVQLAVTAMPALLRSYDSLEIERTRMNRIRDNLAALAQEVTDTNE